MEDTLNYLNVKLNKEWEVLNRYGTVVQGYKLEHAYLTYDEESNIIVVTVDDLEQLSRILNFVDFENEDAVIDAVQRLVKGQGMSEDTAHGILDILMRCSKGLHTFVNVSNGTKIPNEWLGELGLLSGRFLGCSIIGISKDYSLKIIRKSSESLGDVSNIEEDKFVMLYNMVAECYERVLGVPHMTSYVGILIMTLCANAKVQGKVKFINHGNYFDCVDYDMDWIHELESGFKRVEALDDDAETLSRYVNAVLYKDKELESNILKRKGDKEAVSLVDRIDKLESEVQMSNEVIAMLKKEYLPEHLRYYTLEELHTKLKEEQAPKGMNVF